MAWAFIVRSSASREKEWAGYDARPTFRKDQVLLLDTNNLPAHVLKEIAKNPGYDLHDGAEALKVYPKE